MVPLVTNRSAWLASPRLPRREGPGDASADVESARGLFVAQGYAATTMEQIAAGPGSLCRRSTTRSGPRGGPAREVVEVTAAGEDDPVPGLPSALVASRCARPSAQRVLALGVEHGTAIYERVAALWPAVGAASPPTPPVEEYWRGVTAGRRTGRGAMVVRLAGLAASGRVWAPTARRTSSSRSSATTFTGAWSSRPAGPSPRTRLALRTLAQHSWAGSPMHERRVACPSLTAELRHWRGRIPTLRRTRPRPRSGPSGRTGMVSVTSGWHEVDVGLDLLEVRGRRAGGLQVPSSKRLLIANPRWSKPFRR